MRVSLGIICALVLLAISTVPAESTDCSAGVRYETTLHARVTHDTTFSNHRLRVIPVDPIRRIPEMYEVEIPEDAKILKRGKQISAHEIRTGDVMLAHGYWKASTFTAVEIKLNEDGPWEVFDRQRDYRAIEGRALEVDHTEHRLLVDTERGEMEVYVDRARIWLDGNISDHLQLRPDQRIRVRGNVDGRYIDAERVEILSVERNRA